MGKKVAGTVYIKVDGTQLTATGGVEAPLSDIERETIAPGYYNETDRIPFLNCDVIFTEKFDIKLLTKRDDLTVTAELKSGRTYVLQGAYLIGETNVDGSEGSVALEFNGVKGDWQ